jgi:hypothetical protein
MVFEILRRVDKHIWGTRWLSWFGHRAIRRKNVGSIPNCVIIFPAAQWPWDQLILLQVPGMLPWGKGGRCVGLTSPSSCAHFPENLGATNSDSPKGLFRPLQGLLYLSINKDILTFRNVATATFAKRQISQATLLGLAWKRAQASR